MVTFTKRLNKKKSKKSVSHILSIWGKKGRMKRVRYLRCFKSYMLHLRLSEKFEMTHLYSTNSSSETCELRVCC